MDGECGIGFRQAQHRSLSTVRFGFDQMLQKGIAFFFILNFVQRSVHIADHRPRKSVDLKRFVFSPTLSVPYEPSHPFFAIQQLISISGREPFRIP
jgi:hypothetical protein